MRSEKQTIDKIMYCLPLFVRTALEQYRDKAVAEEIRLRIGRPVCITQNGENLFLDSSGTFSHKTDGTVCTKKDIETAVRLLCNNSVYTHSVQMNNGYISCAAGCRAGVTGNFSGDNLHDITSINIRIAHEIKGAADRVFKLHNGRGMVICGAPGCGKTTVLRDIIRQLSDYKGLRVCAVDTRGELSGFSSDGIYTDLGINTDVFFGGEKSRLTQIALRTFSPNVICFDEIGTEAELDAVMQSFNAGTEIITTAHAGSVSDILKRNILKKLILSGAAETVVLMHSRNMQDAQIMTAGDIIKCKLL